MLLMSNCKEASCVTVAERTAAARGLWTLGASLVGFRAKCLLERRVCPGGTLVPPCRQALRQQRREAV